MHPPPPLARFYSPLRAGINRFRDVGACRLTRGVPPRCSIFLFSPPRGTASCKPHTHDDVFSTSAVKSPSYASNLVGRQLLTAETCSRRPSCKRPCVGLLSLAALTNCALANPTDNFSHQSRRPTLLLALTINNQLMTDAAAAAAAPLLAYTQEPRHAKDGNYRRRSRSPSGVVGLDGPIKRRRARDGRTDYYDDNDDSVVAKKVRGQRRDDDRSASRRCDHEEDEDEIPRRPRPQRWGGGALWGGAPSG